MSIADPEIDGLYDPILTVPQPLVQIRQPVRSPRRPWQRICTAAMVVILVVIYATAFVVYLVDVFTHDFRPKDIGLYIFLVSSITQIVLMRALGLIVDRVARRALCRQTQLPSLVLYPAGVSLNGQFVPWRNIGACRWNRYMVGTLMIPIKIGQSQAREQVRVPESHRARVEHMLHRFGKWDPFSGVDKLNAGMGMIVDVRA